MKKELTIIILTSILLVKNIYSQIPNGGFEDWNSIQNYETPINWDTNQDSMFTRFEKDPISVEGEYSLKIIPSSETAWTECMSLAFTKVKLNSSVGENKSLTFYVKSVPDKLNQTEYVFLDINFRFYESGVFVNDYQWETQEIIEEFTYQEIPILNPNVDSLEIYIFGAALNGAADGCYNKTISWIDNFEINTTQITQIKEVDKIAENVIVFPNPSKGIINVQNNGNLISEFELIDSRGIIVERGHLINSTINTNKTGLFFLKLIINDNNDLKVVIKKVLIK